MAQQQTLFYHLSYLDEKGERQIFYVGRTGVGLQKRFSEHKHSAKRESNLKARFWRKLEEMGYVIEIKAISAVDTYDRDVVATIEDRLISRYIHKGHQLINIKTGLAGSVRGRNSTKVVKGKPERTRKEVVWTEEMDKLLGKVADAELAKRFKISKSAVVLKRETKKIPSAEPYVIWTSEMDALLGTMPDKEVAKLVRINRIKVTGRRLQLGIPPFGK
jgi:hypothetical protein